MAINLITGRIYPKIEDIQFPNFKSVQTWWDNYDKVNGYQLDIETNIVDHVIEREIYTVQIGDLKQKTQLVFDIPNLPKDFFNLLMEILQYDCPKYIQFAMFEYTVIKSVFNIEITMIKDTYIQSRLLSCGLPIMKGRDALTGILNRTLHIDLSKEEQTSFAGELLSKKQIEYAALDVAFLYAAYQKQMKLIKDASIQNTLILEEKVVPALGDIEVNGMYLDTDMWNIVGNKNKKNLKIAFDNMIQILKQDDMIEAVKEHNFITPTDTYLFKWASPKQKLILLNLEIPDITSSSQVMLKKYIKSKGTDINPKHNELLILYLNRDYERLETYYINNWNNKLKELGIFIPKDTININFNSPSQVLELFQIIKPQLTSTNATSLAYIDHPLVEHYKKYTKLSKALGSFGESFLSGLSIDGKIHPRIRQILDTGRISMSGSVKGAGSGLQQIPADNRYRNCFRADKGRTFVSIDYSSAELVIIAEWSQDKTMLAALQEGRDMHSVTTSLLFPELWAKAGEPKYPTKKPTSIEGKKLRNWAKATAFGKQQ